MNPREYKDSIFELVRTDDWAKVEEKMVQDEAFAELLLDYVDARLAVDACWSARMRVHKVSYPDKKERALAAKATHVAHLAAIEKRLQLEVKVTETFLGESGMLAEAQRSKELSEAWGRASLAGLI
jgi:hypothetical protein